MQTGQLKEKVQRRAYYRVVYPEDKRPTLIFNNRGYPIVDLCEAGVKFLSNNLRVQNDIMRCTIKFNDGDTVEVVGKVVRIEKDAIALLLIKGIPYKYIHKEQINLR